MLTRELRRQALSPARVSPSLEALEKQIDADSQAAVARAERLDALGADRDRAYTRSTTKNVIGVIEGSGPHAEETVVIGGHYDHLGRGGLFSGSLACSRTHIHNGADDNASGTAMVLEMARRLGARRDPPPRRVVFMAFSGEERGLLGSQYYVKHPLFPLDSTVMMFNCDMVGRLNDKNELTMIGTGTLAGPRRPGRCPGQVGRPDDQEGRRDDRRVRRQRPPVVLSQGHPGPVRLHGRASRLPPAQRRLGPDQLRRHGADRRLPGAAPARRHPPSPSARR